MHTRKTVSSQMKTRNCSEQGRVWFWSQLIPRAVWKQQVPLGCRVCQTLAKLQAEFILNLNSYTGDHWVDKMFAGGNFTSWGTCCISHCVPVDRHVLIAVSQSPVNSCAWSVPLFEPNHIYLGWLLRKWQRVVADIRDGISLTLEALPNHWGLSPVSRGWAVVQRY